MGKTQRKVHEIRKAALRRAQSGEPFCEAIEENERNVGVQTHLAIFIYDGSMANINWRVGGVHQV